MLSLTQTTVKYGYVDATPTFSTDTTIRFNGGTDYTLTNASITSPKIGITPNPQGFPHWFNYNENWTSSGTQPTIGNGTFDAKFSIKGNSCFVRYNFVNGSTTTEGTGNYFVNLPVSSANLTANKSFNLTGYAENNATKGYDVQSARMVDTTKFYVMMNAPSDTNTLPWNATSPFTWAVDDYWSATGFYEIT
jgi:hypothetical protein